MNSFSYPEKQNTDTTAQDKFKQLKAEFILFTASLIWAGTFVVIKVTLFEIPPFSFLALRFWIASVAFILIFKKKIDFRFNQAYKDGLILGIMLFIGFASQTTGLVYTTASNSALITGINILIIPFAQYLILRKKVYLENWIGVISVTIGLYYLTNPSGGGLNIGDLITVICCFAWAFYIVFLDIFSRRSDIPTMVFVQFIFVTVLSTLIAFTFENLNGIIFSGMTVFTIFYSALLATLYATFFCNKYQRYTTPVRAGLILNLEQPVAVLLAVLFLNEKFTPLQFLGGALMIIGVVFSEIFGYIKLQRKYFI